MPIYVGNNKIKPNGIKEAYVGNNKVYSAQPPAQWVTLWTGYQQFKTYSYGTENKFVKRNETIDLPNLSLTGTKFRITGTLASYYNPLEAEHYSGTTVTKSTLRSSGDSNVTLTNFEMEIYNSNGSSQLDINTTSGASDITDKVNNIIECFISTSGTSSSNLRLFINPSTKKLEYYSGRIGSSGSNPQQTLTITKFEQLQ